MPEITLQELQRQYLEAEEADKALWAEQRTNVLLVIGDHYSRRAAQYWDRLRGDQKISEEQRVRLVKNHTQKISKGYVNGLVHYAPNASIHAANPLEAQDQKSAELHTAVKKCLERKLKWRKARRQFARDMVDLGEVFVKAFWDDHAGVPLKDAVGNPILDESGRPVMSGFLKWERIFGFNLMRPKGCKSLDEAPWLGTRKMLPIRELKAMIPPDNEERLKMIEESGTDTYTVYNGANGDYMAVKGQAMLREWYYRPSSDFQNGWYVYWTEKGILWQGELPGGIFPIIYEGFDEIPTSPRHQSIIKVVRPYQMQLNLAGSKEAQHIITLGDDKVFIRHGSKLTPGATQPGIRTSVYTGEKPIITEGRVGAQFAPYCEKTIDEMYDAANMVEEREETNAQVDPKTQLLRLMRHKKKLSTYGEKFEDFIVELWDVSLRLTKHHITPEALVQLVGADERVNISEFKSMNDLGYQIAIEPSSDDPETKMGTQMAIESFMQYVGTKLDKEDIGKFVRLSPYLNKDELFSDLTTDYDQAQNEILALDRGEVRPINKYDNHKYLIRRLTARTKKADFNFLPPQIQKLYAQKISAHEMMLEHLARAQMMAQKGFIPADGPLITCDFYVADPNDPTKQKRLKLPSSSVNWLVQALKNQGSLFDQFSQLPQASQAEIGARLIQPSVGEPSQGDVPDLTGPERAEGVEDGLQP